MSDWISVKYQLPQPGETVLVFLVKPNTIGNYDVAKFLRDEIDGMIKWKIPYVDWVEVTHWMPFCKTLEVAMTEKPVSDASKTRLESGPSAGQFPTPWTLTRAKPEILIQAANGAPIASAVHSYRWIETDTMPVIVHRVNSFDSLLEACRAVSEAADERGAISLKDMQAAVFKVRAAISSAEKQP